MSKAVVIAGIQARMPACSESEALAALQNANWEICSMYRLTGLTHVVPLVEDQVEYALPPRTARVWAAVYKRSADDPGRIIPPVYREEVAGRPRDRGEPYLWWFSGEMFGVHPAPMASSVSGWPRIELECQTAVDLTTQELPIQPDYQLWIWKSLVELAVVKGDERLPGFMKLEAAAEGAMMARQSQMAYPLQPSLSPDVRGLGRRV